MDRVALKCIVAPESEPLQLAAAKRALRIPESQSFHNDQLEKLIRASRSHVEKETARVFMPATFEQRADGFPRWNGVLRLWKAPVTSVTKVEYRDRSSVLRTLASSKYLVDLGSTPARIEPIEGEEWPETDTKSSSVIVTFVAGYGTTALAAEASDLLVAMELILAHWHEHPEATEFMVGGTLMEIPIGAQRIISNYKLDQV